MVDEEYSLKVVILMLNDAGCHAREFLLMGGEGLIYPLHANTGGAHHVLMDARYTEASLGEVGIVTKPICNVRVDEHPSEIGQLGLFIGKGSGIYHEQTD